MSGSSDPFAYVEDWHRRLSQTGWWHSFELPDGTLIAGVNSLEAQKTRLARFPIPADLSGKRVLDIGAWDGWFTFEMERRGADVLAIDRWDNPRFREMHAALNSRAEYRQMKVYDLSPAKVGRFDVVLFLGVLYHLKHPLLALERVCSVTKDFAAVESFTLTERFLPGLQVERHPVLRFFERDDFGGQFDNWFAATPLCLLGLCRTAGFARAELIEVHDYGAALSCYRNFVGQASRPVPLSLHLHSAVHAEDFGINFRSAEDDYVQCLIETPVPVTVETAQPEVGGFGAVPISVVQRADNLWLCTFKLPPGLDPGWQNVRMRIENSEWSNALPIAIDIPINATNLEITAACDGVDWTPNKFSLHHRHLSLWLRGLPENADRANVKVEMERSRQTVNFVGPADAEGLRQINVLADARVAPGHYRLHAEIAGACSPEFNIEAIL